MQEQVIENLIIGAGPVGIYATKLLLENGLEVSIFESGNVNESQKLNRSSYEFRTKSAMPNDVHKIGGGSNLWAGRIGEFTDSDFVENVNRDARWPFTKEALQPFYIRVAQDLGADFHSDEKIIDEISELIEQNSLEGFEIRPYQFIKRDIFLNMFNEFRMDPRLRIETNTTVDQIIPIDERHFKVILTQPGTEPKFVFAKRIFVCCGTLQSTRVLLNSRDLIQSSNPKVLGKNLMEHVEGFVGVIRINKKQNNLFRKLSLNNSNQLSALDSRIGAGLRFSNSIRMEYSISLNCHFEIRKSPRIYPKIFPKFITNPAVRTINLFVKCVWFLYYKMVGFILRMAGIDDYGVWLKAEEFPTDKSELAINSEKIALYDHHVSIETCKEIERSIAIFKKLTHQNNFGNFKPFRWTKEISNNDNFASNWHPMGTLRCGVNRNQSICDPNLRLHGFENLFLLSAAVFPTGSNGNPTFTALALVRKCVDRLTK